MPFSEDLHHEFKGHVNICEEELPQQSSYGIYNNNNKSRSAASRTINAFLNSGWEGVVHLGVSDEGLAKGLNLSHCRKEHVKATVIDLMDRYNPPVEKHRYSINFVPLVREKWDEQTRMNVVSFDTGCNIPPELKSKPHMLRENSHKCWCHKEYQARSTNGKISTQYIVEIVIHAWNPTHPGNRYAKIGKIGALPIHATELGAVYIKLSASVHRCTSQDIWSMGERECLDFYMPKIKQLRKQLEEKKEELKKKPQTLKCNNFLYRFIHGVYILLTACISCTIMVLLWAYIAQRLAFVNRFVK